MTRQDGVPLRPYTTMRVGGPARSFFSGGSVEELREAYAFARENDLPVFVFGGGSNILVADEGFDGIAVKMEIEGVMFEDAGDRVRVIAGAGEDWDTLVEETVARGLYGLENLSLIPGTVGAAPIQNINAYGAQVADVIEWIEVFDARTEEILRMDKDDCKFAYRASMFKENRDLIVTRVAFLLTRTGSVNISYKDLAKYFERKGIVAPTLREVREAVVRIRTGKLPNVNEVGTVGSFFIHPVVPEEEGRRLQEILPDITAISIGGGMVKVLAGKLLDLLGWKNVRRGSVGTHPTHALAIVNYGEDNAHEVFDLAEAMRADVKEKTGIDLAYEVRLVGTFADKK